MYIINVDGMLICDTLGHRTPVTYRFELRPRLHPAPTSVWDEVQIISVLRLVGPAGGELIKYPIRWTHIADQRGFERMLTEAVAILRRRGELKAPDPVATQPTGAAGSDPGRGIDRLVRELLP